MKIKSATLLGMIGAIISIAIYVFFILVNIEAIKLVPEEMDYEQMAEAITEKTKIIMPVDIAGILCDYEKIFDIIESKKQLFTPNSEIQKAFGRVIVVADCAHGFGAIQNGKTAGNIADFTCFSFHWPNSCFQNCRTVTSLQ